MYNVIVVTRCICKVEGVIAAGAFGDVVKVQRKKDGSFYAMKVWPSTLSSSQSVNRSC